MKKTLYLKFIVAYVAFALAGFILISTLGSQLVQRHLVKTISEQIYREANAIASDSMVRYRAASYNLIHIYDNLSSLAVYQDAQIWMMNQRGEILIDTSHSPATPLWPWTVLTRSPGGPAITGQEISSVIFPIPCSVSSPPSPPI